MNERKLIEHVKVKFGKEKECEKYILTNKIKRPTYQLTI